MTPPRIRDIAEALGISIGTVDRALNDRPGVNRMTRARVLQMAATMGYRPNLAARFLSSRRKLRISINVPAQIAVFWDAVRDGIIQEANQLAPASVQLEFRTFPRFASGEEECFEQALASRVDGIILATGVPDRLRPMIRRASRSRIPVVAVVTDAPGTERLGVVGVDSLASGSLAAELLSRFCGAAGKLAMVTGDLRISEHAEKFRSFQAAIASLFPRVQVLPAVENHEYETEAYNQCIALLRRDPDLKGIYISTANSTPVLSALQYLGRLGSVVVITTDLFPELVRHLESGAVIATLYQRPRSQGQMAFRMLHEFLVQGSCPAHQLRLAPHVVMKSNLEFFLKRVDFRRNEPETEAVAGPR